MDTATIEENPVQVKPSFSEVLEAKERLKTKVYCHLIENPPFPGRLEVKYLWSSDNSAKFRANWYIWDTSNPDKPDWQIESQFYTAYEKDDKFVVENTTRGRSGF